jgi:hypothetical protein
VKRFTLGSGSPRGPCGEGEPHAARIRPWQRTRIARLWADDIAEFEVSREGSVLTVRAALAQRDQAACAK